MGMIMKDGIPYGGIYPIDDAPTQGSNNAVKSGGVFSSLSNKVDKVAGKGLSTNDYDNTEKGKVADNTGAIEAIVNKNGCCNVFAIDNPISLSNVSVANNGIVNTDTDSKTVFNCWVATFNSSGQQIQGIFDQAIYSTGHKVLDITIPNNNYYSLQLRHNGSVRDLAIFIPAVPAGDYKMSFDVVGYNPSTVGGLDIRNIMLYDARLNPTGYVQYAMTNAELTKRVTTKKYIYSQTERVVGQWINGNSIYEKTVEIVNLTIPQDGVATINIDDYFANVGKCISYELIDSAGNILPTTMLSSPLYPYNIGVGFDTPNNHITFTRGTGSAVTLSMYLTLRYIKS